MLQRATRNQRTLARMAIWLMIHVRRLNCRLPEAAPCRPQSAKRQPAANPLKRPKARRKMMIRCPKMIEIRCHPRLPRPKHQLMMTRRRR